MSSDTALHRRVRRLPLTADLGFPASTVPPEYREDCERCGRPVYTTGRKYPAGDLVVCVHCGPPGGTEC
jgi:hypothetical protein